MKRNINIISLDGVVCTVTFMVQSENKNKPLLPKNISEPSSIIIEWFMANYNNWLRKSIKFEFFFEILLNLKWLKNIIHWTNLYDGWKV